jgi:hypothetical protein
MSAIHPIATTEAPMNPADPKRALVAQAGLPTGTGPLLGLKFPSFPERDFKNLGALRPPLLGCTLRTLSPDLVPAISARPLLSALRTQVGHRTRSVAISGNLIVD